MCFCAMGAVVFGVAGLPHAELITHEQKAPEAPVIPDHPSQAELVGNHIQECHSALLAC